MNSLCLWFLVHSESWEWLATLILIFPLSDYYYHYYFWSHLLSNFFSIFWTSESLTEAIIMISRKDIPNHHIQKAQFRNYSWKALVTQKKMQRHPLSRNILYLSALPQMHICSKPIITRKVLLENMQTHLKIIDTHTHMYIHIHTHTDKIQKLFHSMPLLSWLINELIG